MTKTLVFAGEGDYAKVRAAPGRCQSRMRPASAQDVPGVRQCNRCGALGDHGRPITYMHEGKQFIVVAIVGLDHEQEFVALTLPYPAS